MKDIEIADINFTLVKKAHFEEAKANLDDCVNSLQSYADKAYGIDPRFGDLIHRLYELNHRAGTTYRNFSYMVVDIIKEIEEEVKKEEG